MRKRTVFLAVALAMFVRAAKDAATGKFVCQDGFTRLGVGCHIYSAPLPRLDGLLPPAVREVVQLHAEGRTHAEIAAQRSTSKRTVANQLSAAFQKLGVSGRPGLLEYLSVKH